MKISIAAIGLKINHSIEQESAFHVTLLRILLFETFHSFQKIFAIEFV